MEQLALCLRERRVAKVVAAFKRLQRRDGVVRREHGDRLSHLVVLAVLLLLLGLRQCFIRMRTPTLSTAIRWPPCAGTPSRQRLKSLWQSLQLIDGPTSFTVSLSIPVSRSGQVAAGTWQERPPVSGISTKEPKSAAGSITIDARRAPRAAARAVAPREPPRRRALAPDGGENRGSATARSRRIH